MGKINHISSLLAVFIGLSVTFSTVSAQTDYEKQRKKMVIEQIASRGISDPHVIAAMLRVPRHLFVPSENRIMAYDDRPLSIGEGQTISQPYIVALMTQLLNIKPGMKILEVGTGSGYQAAILAELNTNVFSIEIIRSLGMRARQLLDSLEYDNINVTIGDGYKGWPENAPFDAIIVTCAPSDVPEPLIAQLKEGGIMVIPVGERFVQELVILRKKNGKTIIENVASVMFVPMVSPDGTRY
jgi:protein-L-isoaspartate(D-aspartate) O-methyltransferase